MGKNLVVGLGEIGRSVVEVLDNASLEVYGRDIQGFDDAYDEVPAEFDVLHVCFPYSKSFIRDVLDYQHMYRVQHTIIWSTVQINTTSHIMHAVHSPVEGRHPNLARSIQTMVRWVGYDDIEERKFAEKFFNYLGLHTRMVQNSRITEALKLLSTTEYGVNLMFADYKRQVMEDLDADFQLTKEWNHDYNRLYSRLGEHQFQKFVLDAPKGHIGGHCVIPNAKLLQERHPHEFNQMLGDFE